MVNILEQLDKVTKALEKIAENTDPKKFVITKETLASILSYAFCVGVTENRPMLAYYTEDFKTAFGIDYIETSIQEREYLLAFIKEVTEK